MNYLENFTHEQLAPLLAESNYAFLPTKKHPDETATSLVEKFKHDKNYAVFGYSIENKPVSYIMALSGRTDHEIAIGPMYVAKSFRGKGIGKRQIKEFVQLCTAQGYTSIYTKTWLGNNTSRHSFESLGFIEIDRQDGDRADGDSTISYTLQTIKP